MERTYTILLNRGGAPTARYHFGRSAFGQPLESQSQFLSEPLRPAIHREKLTAQELQELVAEPDFVAAAEVMSTRLLSPVAAASFEPTAVIEGEPAGDSPGASPRSAPTARNTPERM